MPSSRAVLIDIAVNGLNPGEHHRVVGADGRLRGAPQVEPVVVQSPFQSTTAPNPEPVKPRVKRKKKVVAPVIKDVETIVVDVEDEPVVRRTSRRSKSED